MVSLKTNFPDKEIETFETRDYGTDNFIEDEQVGKLTGLRMGSYSSQFVRIKSIITQDIIGKILSPAKIGFSFFTIL